MVESCIGVWVKQLSIPASGIKPVYPLWWVLIERKSSVCGWQYIYFLTSVCVRQFVHVWVCVFLCIRMYDVHMNSYGSGVCVSKFFGVGSIDVYSVCIHFFYVAIAGKKYGYICNSLIKILVCNFRILGLLTHQSSMGFFLCQFLFIQMISKWIICWQLYL